MVSTVLSIILGVLNSASASPLLLSTRLHVCCVKFSLFRLIIHPTPHSLLRLIIPGIINGLQTDQQIEPATAAAETAAGVACLGTSSATESSGHSGPWAGGTVRVVAFDRVPFGFSGRPSSWLEKDGNPYTVQAGK